MYANIRTMNNDDSEKKQRCTKKGIKRAEYCKIFVQNFVGKYSKKIKLT